MPNFYKMMSFEGDFVSFRTCFDFLGARCICTNKFPTSNGNNGQGCRTQCNANTECSSAQTCCGGNRDIKLEYIKDLIKFMT